MNMAEERQPEAGQAGPWRLCPLCGRPGQPDGRRIAEIAGRPFESVTCEAPPKEPTDHWFPVRWLESSVSDADELQQLHERFVYVRGPLPEGSPIEEAFGETDPIRAWIEDQATDEGLRVLIRL